MIEKKVLRPNIASEVNSLSSPLKCIISRKKWMMKFIFVMQIRIEVFYKLVQSFSVCIASMYKVPKIRSFHIFGISPKKRVKSTPNNKFAISLQYLKKNVNNEVDVLSGNEHRRFLQIDTIVLGMRGQACPNYPN